MKLPWVSRHRYEAAMTTAHERGVRAATWEARYHALATKLLTPPVTPPPPVLPAPAIPVSAEAKALKKLSDDTTARMAQHIAESSGIPLDRATAEAEALCRDADRLMFGELSL